MCGTAARKARQRGGEPTCMVLRCVFATVILLIGPTFAKAGVTGVAVDQSDNPVPGVRVYGSKTTCCPSKAEETRTNAQGYFTLADPGKVIYIRADGFRPTSRVLALGTASVRILLEPAGYTTWKVPECDSQHPSGGK